MQLPKWLPLARALAPDAVPSTTSLTPSTTHARSSTPCQKPIFPPSSKRPRASRQRLLIKQQSRHHSLHIVILEKCRRGFHLAPSKGPTFPPKRPEPSPYASQKWAPAPIVPSPLDPFRLPRTPHQHLLPHLQLGLEDLHHLPFLAMRPLKTPLELWPPRRLRLRLRESFPQGKSGPAWIQARNCKRFWVDMSRHLLRLLAAAGRQTSII